MFGEAYIAPDSGSLLNDVIADADSEVISYLSDESRKNNSPSFTIPFNRQQLADFLSVDRSAMSNELCKMREEGLITFHRNDFTLLQHEII